MTGRTFLIFTLLAVLILSSTGCNPTVGKADPAATVGAKTSPPAATAIRATVTPKPEPAIVVTAPIAGQVLRSPVRVSGTASVFEGTVTIAVKDSSGKVIGKSSTQATVGAPMRGAFSADITFTQPLSAESGTVEVYDLSAKDGSVKDLVGIKVSLAGR